MAQSSGRSAVTFSPETPQNVTPQNVTPQNVTPQNAAPQETGLYGKQLAIIFSGLLLAMFVSALSETIAATALPTIVGDLGGVEIMQWVTTTYILASTITMPLYGKLSDDIGCKKLLIIGLVVYTIGKVICAISPNMAMLLAGRIVSGLGGGGLIILSQSAIATVVPPRRRGLYLGIMGAVFTVSNVLGPLLGGWFVQAFGWRFIFWFTVPLAAVAIFVLAVWYHDPDKHTATLRFDWQGACALSITVIALVLAMAWGGNEFAWLSWQIGGLFALFVVFSALFVFIEKRAEAPIIPMMLFQNRNFNLCCAAGLLVNVAFMGALTYLPTYFQIADRLSPAMAGMIMVPGSIGAFVSSMGTGWLAGKTGHYKWMLIAMCLVCGGGFFLMATMDQVPVWADSAYIFLMGFGMGLGSQILLLVVQNEFPQSAVGTATAANNFFKQIGSTVGSSLVGTLFTARLVSDLAGKLPASTHISLADITPSMVDALPSHWQNVIAAGYSDALLPLFLCCVPLMIACLVMVVFVIPHPLAKTLNHGGQQTATVEHQVSAQGNTVVEHQVSAQDNATAEHQASPQGNNPQDNATVEHQASAQGNAETD